MIAFLLKGRDSTCVVVCGIGVYGRGYRLPLGNQSARLPIKKE